MHFKDRVAGCLITAVIALCVTPAIVHGAGSQANASGGANKRPSATAKVKLGGPVNRHDLQGAWEAIKQATWDKYANRWSETKCAGSIALTRISPGHYKFPGFNDVLTGTTTSCAGVFKAAAMATSPGGSAQKPQPKPVRFQLQNGLLYEYLGGDHNSRYTYKKISDDPKVWAKM